VDYTALREQFPSLEIDCLIPKNIIRKQTEELRDRIVRVTPNSQRAREINRATKRS
jgi:hypothetical protein